MDIHSLMLQFTECVPPTATTTKVTLGVALWATGAQWTEAVRFAFFNLGGIRHGMPVR